MSLVQYIHDINKHNLTKPGNTDQVFYSELSDFFTSNAFRSFSIKYVIGDGCTYYKPYGKEYKLSKGDILIAMKQPDVTGYVHSKYPVRSICIDICEESILDVFNSFKNEEKHGITDFGADKSKFPDFSEAVYSSSDKSLFNQLQKVCHLIGDSVQSNHQVTVEKEWFLETAQLVMISEFKKEELIQKLDSLKLSTKKEILRRISRGKDFIDSYFLTNPNIKTVARESNMSEFHFFRCYKRVFGISPYQYMLSKRLEYAKNLLTERTMRVSEVATKCGFPDLFTFSKAFKRKFGFSPSAMYSKDAIAQTGSF